MRLYHVLTAVAAFFFSFALCGAQSYAGDDMIPLQDQNVLRYDNRRMLRVMGKAERLLPPDVCYIKFSRETIDRESVAAAYKTNALAMAAISSVIKQLGIDSKDMQTTNLQLNPEYQYDSGSNKAIKVGYRVSQELSVKVYDMGKVSLLIDAGVASGATEMGSVSFTVENPQKYEMEIQIEALKDAKAKALKICEVTTMTLGKPISITESNTHVNEATYFRGAATSANFRSSSASSGSTSSGTDLQVEPGEIKLQSSVTIIYEIL